MVLYCCTSHNPNEADHARKIDSAINIILQMILTCHKCKVFVNFEMKIDILKRLVFTRTSAAQTLMTHLPWLFRLILESPGKKIP